MDFLALFRDAVLNFLFPKKKELMAIEALPPYKLAALIPPAGLKGKEGFLALFDYAHPLTKEIVWEIKYRGNRVLADKVGEILFERVSGLLTKNKQLKETGAILLVPVPISDRRRFERGYNQTELLTQAIKKFDTGALLKHLPIGLIKTFHTESQTRTSGRKERLENLRTSMKVMNPQKVAGRIVVVIDDVATTGATFIEAKRALREARAKKIICLALAH